MQVLRGPLDGGILKFLVTGGAGFIGSNLVKKLLQSSHEVVVIDNFSTSTGANLHQFKNNSNLKVIAHDVNKAFDLDCDFIYHLACPASPVNYQLNPIETLKTNFMGSLNMLTLAKKNEVPIFFSSTSEVYGDPLISPQPESYFGNVNPIGIRSCYDEGKRAAESLFFNFKLIHDIDIRVVRIFNTYGPNMAIDDGRVVSNFICQALKGEDLTIYGNGSQTRSLCYVDDLIDAMIIYAFKEQGHDSPMNFGNDDEISIKFLAETIIKLTGSKSKVVFLPLPQDDPNQRRPNLALVKSILDWEAKTNLETGLEKSINYFRNLI
jgi:UDP-glucuronate decarboxylase